MKNNPPVREEAAKDDGTTRLNRYVANAGVCSRREADVLIAAGNVTVNGKPVTEMGHKVQLTDEVRFDGRLLNPEKKVYVLLNKPKDFTSTTRDEKGKRHVSGLISNASKKPLMPIDVLNKKDTGLMLFTNDADLAQKLQHAKNGFRKVYQVTLDKEVSKKDIQAIQEGVEVDASPVRVREISFIDGSPRSEVGIEIFSTRNKIVERLFKQLGYEVVKLDRVIYGGLTKKDLPRGHWRYLTEMEVTNLKMVK